VPTVVFDFDSTLIDHESLDALLAELLADRPGAADEVRAITDAGMEGRIPFRESMERRLAILAPTRAQVEDYARRLPARVTPGMPALLADLRAEVWIVSGGLVEMLLPTARTLGVPDARVVGTLARWEADGTFGGLLRCGPKEETLAEPAASWRRPRIVVGDGMSDHAVFAAGLAERFVAYTQHVRRAPVVATGAPEARDVAALRYLLQSWP